MSSIRCSYKTRFTEGLLKARADLTARLKFLLADGTLEVKQINGQKYIYIRKRINGKLTSDYKGEYSDELYQLLQKHIDESRSLRKSLREINRQLANAGYIEKNPSERVQHNLDFARVNLKNIIYDQAILEGVATTFPQTEEIVENGRVSGMTATDILKVLNLKHAWEFILDPDVIQSQANLGLLEYIAGLVNEGLIADGGRLRGVPVAIRGSKYVPDLPIRSIVEEHLQEIIDRHQSIIDEAIDLILYVMKAQIFLDGNKRTAIIFANHYLISHGQGIIAVPYDKVEKFRDLLVRYYDGTDVQGVRNFLKKECWQNNF